VELGLLPNERLDFYRSLRANTVVRALCPLLSRSFENGVTFLSLVHTRPAEPNVPLRGALAIKEHRFNLDGAVTDRITRTLFYALLLQEEGRKKQEAEPSS
jgi:hypothetical protein